MNEESALSAPERGAARVVVLSPDRRSLIMVAICRAGELTISIRDDRCSVVDLRAVPAGLAAENGRGLFLVDALDGAWGAASDADGTSVWFRLPSGYLVQTLRPQRSEPRCPPCPGVYCRSAIASASFAWAPVTVVVYTSLAG
jgi:hypothetical protein